MPEPARLAKLSTLADSDWRPNRYDRVWWREATTGPSRIAAAVSEDQVETALRLASCVPGPFLILWVLHTPRGGSEPGRYQSPPLPFDEVQRLLLRYRDLFEQDGRSDLWIHAGDPAATIVLDRHDIIYAYGPEDAFLSVLGEFGNARAAIPSPHAHDYHAEFDELERGFARELDWKISELRPEDEP